MAGLCSLRFYGVPVQYGERLKLRQHGRSPGMLRRL